MAGSDVVASVVNNGRGLIGVAGSINGPGGSISNIAENGLQVQAFAGAVTGIRTAFVSFFEFFKIVRDLFTGDISFRDMMSGRTSPTEAFASATQRENDGRTPTAGSHMNNVLGDPSGALTGAAGGYALGRTAAIGVDLSDRAARSALSRLGTGVGAAPNAGFFGHLLGRTRLGKALTLGGVAVMPFITADSEAAQQEVPEGARLITVTRDQLAGQDPSLISASDQYVFDPATNAVTPVEHFQAASTYAENVTQAAADLIPMGNTVHALYQDEAFTPEVRDAAIVDTAELAGGISGAWAGAAAGAAIGSFVPIVGTAIGAGVGGILGYLAGDAVGNMAGEHITHAFNENADPSPESPAYTHAPVVATYANNFRPGG